MNNPNKGLIPRALDCIFSYSLPKDKFEFKISFLEIYNDVVTDLLDTDSATPNHGFNEFTLKMNKNTQR